jgi:hypothetical protein
VFNRQRFYNETREVINQPIVCALDAGHPGTHRSGRDDRWDDEWAVYP